MVMVVDTTCQICGKDLFATGEETLHPIENSDGYSCDRCFYKKAFQYWKLKSKKLQKLLRQVQDELSFCLFCDVDYNEDYKRRIQHVDSCELAKELGDEEV